MPKSEKLEIAQITVPIADFDSRRAWCWPNSKGLRIGLGQNGIFHGTTCYVSKLLSVLRVYELILCFPVYFSRIKII